MSHLNATLWYIEYQTLVFKIVSIEFVFDSDDKILVVTVYVPCRHR